MSHKKKKVRENNPQQNCTTEDSRKRFKKNDIRWQSWLKEKKNKEKKHKNKNS